MRTKWDYTNLADAYLKRSDYSVQAINEVLAFMKIPSKAKVCDVGAGNAILTISLAQKGFSISAVEPNDAMRENGINRTLSLTNVKWYEGTGENTGQPSSTFDLVTFGSSFNVTDRSLALKECSRILKPKSWFVCLWNHRDLNDTIQSEIEGIIKAYIKNYDYGSRREDQTPVIDESGLFLEVHKREGYVCHKQNTEDFVEAWRSHGTLHKQAGDKFEEIIKEIESLLLRKDQPEIIIPYITRIWFAQRK